MSNTQLTYIRTLSSAAITGLAVVYSLYPSYTWITAVIAAAATLGIHAIPSVGQPTGGKAMTSPEDGSVLMGFNRPQQPVEAPVEAAEAPVEVAESPKVPQVQFSSPAGEDTQPDIPVVERTAPVDPENVTQSDDMPVSATVPTLPDRLRQIAAELDQILS